MHSRDAQQNRQQVARNITGFRFLERYAPEEDQYETERSVKHYDCLLLGLSEFFHFVMSQPGLPRRVLEIGVGKANAFAEIVQKYQGALSFLGTALRMPAKESVAKLVRLTSVEVLRGIPPESLGGIYGVYSLPYGKPELARKRLDEVLAPGGVIKGVFPQETQEHMHGYREYTAHWEGLGYDVAVFLTTDDLYRQLGLDRWEYNWSATAIVVAIKPGGVNKHLSAQELLESDFAAYRKQLDDEKQSNVTQRQIRVNYRLQMQVPKPDA